MKYLLFIVKMKKHVGVVVYEVKREVVMYRNINFRLYW